MNVRHMPASREVLAGAKLNLFLEVLGKRADGFHEIETLMVAVSLYDTLRAQSPPPGAAAQVVLEVQTAAGLPGASGTADKSLPTDADNLVVRAAHLLAERLGEPVPARLTLFKRIPVASGMAGGSTDAAAALRLLATAEQLPAADLALLAGRLGSDVPFFLHRSAAVCRGRGERIEPIDRLPVLHFVVVRPPVGLSTAEVYRHCQPAAEPRRVEPLIDALRAGRLAAAGRLLHNRLQAPAQRLCRQIAEVARQFDRLDFLGHQLSGSGTSYLGLCRHARHARRLAAQVRALRLGTVWHLQTVMQAPAVFPLAARSEPRAA